MKNNITVYIDTSDNTKAVVALIIDGVRHEVTASATPQKSQIVLPLIQQLLQERQLTVNDVASLEVRNGPGSFTGLRVGAAIANTLAWLLDIPVNGEKGKPFEPKYS